MPGYTERLRFGLKTTFISLFLCSYPSVSRACGSVAVKSTGTWVYGETKIWTEDHFHFLVPLLISSLSHEAYYNAAKVMRSTIAVCVEAGGLAVRTTVGRSTTMFLSRRYIKGIPLSLTQS